MTVVKNCSGRHAELVPAISDRALIDEPRRNALGLGLASLTILDSSRCFGGLVAPNIFCSALQANHAIRPAHLLKVVNAGLLGRKLFGYVYQVHRKCLLDVVCTHRLTLSSI